MNTRGLSPRLLRRFAACLAFLGFVSGAALFVIHKKSASSDSEPVLSALRSDSKTLSVPHWNQPSSLIYPYSVVRGGVANLDALQSAASSDPVVAKHYSDFNLPATHVVQLSAAKLAYVSYRLDNKIYWTRHKLLIRAGEPLLSDGSHLARTRCGNRISEIPKGPTSHDEPPARAFEDPVSTQPPLIYEPTPFFTLELMPDDTQTLILPPSNFPIPLGGFIPPNLGLPPIPPIFVPPIGGSPGTPPQNPPPPPVATPEPGTLVLLLAGAACAALFRRMCSNGNLR